MDGLDQMIFLFQGARILRFQPFIFRGENPPKSLQRFFLRLPLCSQSCSTNLGSWWSFPPAWKGTTTLNFLKAKPKGIATETLLAVFPSKQNLGIAKKWVIYLYIYINTYQIILCAVQIVCSKKNTHFWCMPKNASLPAHQNRAPALAETPQASHALEKDSKTPARLNDLHQDNHSSMGLPSKKPTWNTPINTWNIPHKYLAKTHQV